MTCSNMIHWFQLQHLELVLLIKRMLLDLISWFALFCAQNSLCASWQQCCNAQKCMLWMPKPNFLFSFLLLWGHPVGASQMSQLLLVKMCHVRSPQNNNKWWHSDHRSLLSTSSISRILCCKKQQNFCDWWIDSTSFIQHISGILMNWFFNVIHSTGLNNDLDMPGSNVAHQLQHKSSAMNFPFLFNTDLCACIELVFALRPSTMIWTCQVLLLWLTHKL